MRYRPPPYRKTRLGRLSNLLTKLVEAAGLEPAYSTYSVNGCLEDS
ncbi:hypothetical protein [Escherichia phage vB_EcoM_ULIM9]|nr:hypothetical protein [Escherichia phage vB_EcoM_ULIM9]